MRVSVFGLGYVGCVTAGCVAAGGHEVIGVDVNKEKVAMVAAGVSPIVEPGLGELLAEVVSAKHLTATTSTEDAVSASDMALICVGTPGLPSGQLDARALTRLAEAIGHALRSHPKPYMVVLRSTVIPGTTEQLLLPTLWAAAGSRAAPDLRVAVNPEFMREGSSLRDFAAPPFTLVGCEDEEATSRIRTLYAGIGAPFIRTSLKAAEMIKYVGNAFHALKVCFGNEIGDLCEALGVNPHEVIETFLLDRKLNISEAYLRPGFAFGGSCLPKDLRALLHAARTADVGLPLLSAILPSNDAQIRRAAETVLQTRRRRVGVVGLSFKTGTDDLRESPTVLLIETLIGKGCEVRILDRNVSLSRLVGANRRYIEEEIPHIASLMCEDVDTLLGHAEVLVIANVGEEATRALAAVGPSHIVIDLTRGALDRT